MCLQASAVSVPAVYSVILSDGGVAVTIDGVQCLTWAHGVQNDPVATHAFFGSDCVVAALKRRAGWETGRVDIAQAVFQRGPDGHVCGF